MKLHSLSKLESSVFVQYLSQGAAAAAAATMLFSCVLSVVGVVGAVGACADVESVQGIVGVKALLRPRCNPLPQLFTVLTECRVARGRGERRVQHFVGVDSAQAKVVQTCAESEKYETLKERKRISVSSAVSPALLCRL
jgi:hypothetical protein